MKRYRIMDINGSNMSSSFMTVEYLKLSGIANLVDEAMDNEEREI
jgi:hypothetical protein